MFGKGSYILMLEDKLLMSFGIVFFRFFLLMYFLNLEVKFVGENESDILIFM